MHINEAKEVIKDKLYTFGLTAFSNYHDKGDYALYVACAFNKITVRPKSEKFLAVKDKFKQEIAINDFCRCSEDEDGVIHLRNTSWEVYKKVRQTVDPAGSGVDEPADNEPMVLDIATPKEEERAVPEKMIFTGDDIELNRDPDDEMNKNLIRFGKTLDRMEEVLDEFNLNKLGFTELLKQIFDALKEEGIEMYTTASPIQLVENRIVVPMITKDMFLATALKAIKKYQLNGNKQ